jgi:glycolate oxidase
VERTIAEANANGAIEVRSARDARERELLWKGRKGAIGSLGRLAPNYYILDGVVPRSKLVDVMRDVARVSAEYDLPIANVFHAGDGNLHPLLLFDDRVAGAKEKVLAAGAEIMRACVDFGGALSGEHGIGYEKQQFMPWLYDPLDIENMARLKAVFGNEGAFNPCKLLPAGTGCGEMAHQEVAILAAGPDAYV